MSCPARCNSLARAGTRKAASKPSACRASLDAALNSRAAAQSGHVPPVPKTVSARADANYFFGGRAIPVNASQTRMTNESSFSPWPFAAAARNNWCAAAAIGNGKVSARA